MPRVTVESTLQNRETGRTLDEAVSPEQLDSEESAAAFVERLGWAIAAAHECEADARERKP